MNTFKSSSFRFAAVLRPAAFLTAALLVGGCTLAPRYERPASPVAASYPVGENSASSTRSELSATSVGGAQDTHSAQTGAADLAWKDYFTDARLSRLISLALDNNRDLRVSTLNVEELRAQYRIQRASLLPSVSATGSSSRSRTPAEIAGTSQAVVSGQYGVSVGAASWELDLFGRVRSLKDKALETYLAADETRLAARLSLIASVANQYLTERAYAEQLDLARATLASVSHSRDLTQRSFELGGSSDLDVQSAQSEVLTAEANVAKYQRELAAATHALEVLVGCSLPADLPAAGRLSTLSFPAALRAGLPSELLQNRPDILAAEHTLKAANANIGAARAAFFPKIALTASAGTASTELSGLFKAGSENWSFAPQISLPLFTAGANKASLDYAQLAKQVEVAKYEAAIQTAFKEVADTLSAQAPLDREVAAYEALVQTQQKRLQLAEARHRNGAASYLEVLTAQESLYSAQQSLITTQLTRLQNLVSFYEVLGGGSHTDASLK